MKNIITSFILSSLFLVSCSNDDSSSGVKPVDIYAVDLNTIEATSTKNPITVRVTSVSGEDINDVTQLQPNTIYHLLVKGSGASFYRIKSSDGFVVVKNPNTNRGSSDEVEFVVKTSQEVIGDLYVNIVPIQIHGQTMLRESPQVFLLPG